MGGELGCDTRRLPWSAERKFNEGAAQVKRLLNRDRSAVPDLDKPDSFSTETDDGGDLTEDVPSTSGATPTSPGAPGPYSTDAKDLQCAHIDAEWSPWTHNDQ